MQNFNFLLKFKLEIFNWSCCLYNWNTFFFLAKYTWRKHYSLYLCVKTLSSSLLPTVFLLIKKCTYMESVEKYWVQGKEWVSQGTLNIINRDFIWILDIIQSSEWMLCIRQKDGRDLILPTKHSRYFCGLRQLPQCSVYWGCSQKFKIFFLICT